MAWTPAQNTGMTAQFDQRILDYIAANQADALTWASIDTLPPFKQISDSVANRTKPVYPSLAVRESSEAEDAEGDILNISFSITFEAFIWADNATVSGITSTAKSYALALKSLLRNIDKATLFEIDDTSATAPSSMAVGPIEASYETLKTNDTQNAFIQEFQVRVTYDIWQKLII